MTQGVKERLRILYVSSLIRSFGESLASSQGVGTSFISMFTVELGATPSQLGWFYSIQISARSMLQLIWGLLSDKMGRRVPFIVLGGLGVSLLWFPMLFIRSPTTLLLLLAIQAVFYSVFTPNWMSLIGDIAPKSSRGVITANISLYTNISGLIATFVSGFIMMNIIGSLKDVYFIPFSAATIFGVIGILITLLVKEEPNKKGTSRKAIKINDVIDVIKNISNERDFLKYTIVSLLSSMVMVMLLPVMSIMTIKILKVEKLTFALYGVIRCITLLFSQSWLGKVTDLAGRKQLLIIQRLCYITIPSLFVFAPNGIFIFIPYAILGFLHAINATAHQSYLLDMCPQEQRGSFIAVYGLIEGIGSFCSSLFGGYLIDIFSKSLSLIGALRIVAIITTIARVPTAFLFMTLREKRTYPSTITDEIKKIFASWHLSR